MHFHPPFPNYQNQGSKTMLALRTQALVPAGYWQKNDIVFTHWACNCVQISLIFLPSGAILKRVIKHTTRASNTSSLTGCLHLTRLKVTKLIIDRVYHHGILRGSTLLHLPYRY